MGLIAAAQERPFAEDELFVWMADGGGVILAAEPVFTRLCGADPAGQALAALAEPVPVLDRPDAALIKHVAADGAVFWAHGVHAAGGRRGARRRFQAGGAGGLRGRGRGAAGAARPRRSGG